MSAIKTLLSKLMSLGKPENRNKVVATPSHQPDPTSQGNQRQDWFQAIHGNDS